jgi:PIN domain
MLRLLIDTSVWLDLAKHRDGQRWIVPLRLLQFQGKLELLVPSLVIDEFERNRPRAEAAVTANVLERFRLLRRDLHEYGGENRQQWLEEMTHQIPLISAITLQNFAEISELLLRGRRLEPTESEHERVVQRALEKKAPFHRERNSVADALLIELYSSEVGGNDTVVDQYCFVTSNYLDFSLLNGDRRQPHHDISGLFTDERSRYVYDVIGLNEFLVDYFGQEFIEESEETQIVHEEPRTLAEILEAEQEYFDKVWYVRKLILIEKIEAGEHEPPSPDLSDRMHAAMGAVEERYGRDNVGPWDDWDWGFVNGKLSALRWVLGSEWDDLDT